MLLDKRITLESRTYLLKGREVSTTVQTQDALGEDHGDRRANSNKTNIQISFGRQTEVLNFFKICFFLSSSLNMFKPPKYLDSLVNRLNLL